MSDRLPLVGPIDQVPVGIVKGEAIQALDDALAGVPLGVYDEHIKGWLVISRARSWSSRAWWSEPGRLGSRKADAAASRTLRGTHDQDRNGEATHEAPHSHHDRGSGPDPHELWLWVRRHARRTEPTVRLQARLSCLQCALAWVS